MSAPIFQAATGIELEAFDASTVAQTYLARLPDGRQFQLSTQLYQLLCCLDQALSGPELAERFAQHSGNRIEQDVLLEVMTKVLHPRGLVTMEVDGAPIAVDEANPASAPSRSLLDLHLTWNICSGARLAPLTKLLAVLYKPAIVVLLLLLTLIAHIIAYMQLGLPPKYDASQVSVPLTLLLVLIGMVVHELGHMAACRFWHCTHGDLGVGIYFFAPVLYVDVSSTWRISRWKRVVVDLGGIYFQLAFTIVLAIGYLASSNLTLLWVIIISDLIVLFNLNPLIKLDGYWIIADALGVPNLHQRVGELLRYGLSWLRGKPTTLVRSPFGQFPPLILMAVVVYAVLAVDLWMLLLATMIPAVVQILLNLPSDVVVAARNLREALALLDVSLALRGLEILFLPSLVAINVALIVIKLSRTSIERIARRSTGNGK